MHAGGGRMDRQNCSVLIENGMRESKEASAPSSCTDSKWTKADSEKFTPATSKCSNTTLRQSNVTNALPSQLQTMSSLFCKSGIVITPHEPVPCLESVTYYTAPHSGNTSKVDPNESQELLLKDGNNLSAQASGHPRTYVTQDPCQLGGEATQYSIKRRCLPKCLHGFRFKRLTRRLRPNSRKCPVCSDDTASILPDGTMFIKPNSKPSTLVIHTTNSTTNDCLNTEQRQNLRCSSSTTHLSVHPVQQHDDGRFSCAYVCGSTFNVSLLPNTKHATLEETWSATFDSVSFLERIQARAEEHAKKCIQCRRGMAKKTSSSSSMVAASVVGTMPTGIMRVDHCPDLHCSGYQDTATAGSFRITYTFRRGLQADYHINPGEPYDATTREAYLPNNEEGRALLKRLKVAFCLGHTFRIGTSLTTGTKNAIIWCIPHKTSLAQYGQPMSNNQTFSFPDANYVSTAHKSMNDLKIPSSP